jgi:hypothetical protein
MWVLHLSFRGVLFSHHEHRRRVNPGFRQWPSALRTAVAVPLVVVLLTAAGCTNRATVPEPSATTPYVVEGDRAWIPVEALLQPVDVGPGHHVENENTGQPGAYPTWSFAVGECAAYAGTGMNNFKGYAFLRFHSVVPDGRTGGDPGTVFVEVRRYSQAMAATVVADVPQMVSACPIHNSAVAAGVAGNGSTSASRDPAHVVNTWTVIGEGFAGNDSLLIREETVEIDESTGQPVRVNGETSSVLTSALVRVADLVAVVQSSTTDSALLRDLGAKAAARLCVAATPRC